MIGVRRAMLAGWLLLGAAACSRSSGPGLDGIPAQGAGPAGNDAPVTEDHSLAADELPDLPARWVTIEDAEGLSLLRFGDVAPAEIVLGPRTENIGEVQSWSYEATWSPDGESVAFLTHVVDSGEPLLQVAQRARDWQPRAAELPRSGRIVPRWAGANTLVISTQPLGEKTFQQWLVRVGDSVSSELLGGGLPWAVWESRQGPALVLGEESLLVTDGAAPQPLSTDGLFVGCLPSSGALACLEDVCDRLHWSPDGRFIAGCQLSTAIPSSAGAPTAADPQGPLSAGDVHIGVIPLPPGRELIDPNPHGDLDYYSTPTALQWAPAGSLAAYVMYNYPVSAKSDFECAPRRLEIVDVATAELLNQIELDCGTPDHNERSFSFADAAHVLVARVSTSGAGVELLRASSEGEPELLAELAGESAPSVRVSADGQGVYLVTHREEAELTMVRFARLAELDRSGAFVELSLPGRPLLYTVKTQGAALRFELEGQAPCTQSCLAVHVLEPGDGEIRDTVVDGSDRDVHFVPETGIIGPRPGGGLVLRLEHAFDVAYAIRDESAWWVSAPPRFD